MNTDAVEAFLAVAADGQFQRAAARLGLSQQAVSKRVAALEAELGTTLFRRTPGGAELSPAGLTFRPHAQAVVAAVRAAAESVQSRPAARPLRVDVLARRSGPVQLLRAFQRACPDVPVQAVAGGGAAATVKALHDGEVDAGYAYLRDRAADLGSALTSAYASLEPVQVIVGPRHPLAAGGPVRAGSLARYPAWVPGIRAGSEWETFYADFAADFGLDIDPANYTSGTESVFDDIADSPTLLTYVAAQNRVALPDGAGLVRRAVTDPVPLYPWSLVWRSQTRDPATRRLVAHVRRSFTPPGRAAVWLPRQARDDLAG